MSLHHTAASLSIQSKLECRRISTTVFWTAFITHIKLNGLRGSFVVLQLPSQVSPLCGQFPSQYIKSQNTDMRHGWIAILGSTLSFMPVREGNIPILQQ